MFVYQAYLFTITTTTTTANFHVSHDHPVLDAASFLLHPIYPAPNHRPCSLSCKQTHCPFWSGLAWPPNPVVSFSRCVPLSHLQTKGQYNGFCEPLHMFARSRSSLLFSFSLCQCVSLSVCVCNFYLLLLYYLTSFSAMRCFPPGSPGWR